MQRHMTFEFVPKEKYKVFLSVCWNFEMVNGPVHKFQLIPSIPFCWFVFIFVCGLCSSLKVVLWVDVSEL